MYVRRQCTKFIELFTTDISRTNHMLHLIWDEHTITSIEKYELNGRFFFFLIIREKILG